MCKRLNPHHFYHNHRHFHSQLAREKVQRRHLPRFLMGLLLGVPLVFSGGAITERSTGCSGGGTPETFIQTYVIQ